jgi:hypothetical protein
MGDKITIEMTREEAVTLLTDVLPSLAKAAQSAGRHALVVLASDLTVRLVEADVIDLDDDDRDAVVRAAKEVSSTAKVAAVLADSVDLLSSLGGDLDVAGAVAEALGVPAGSVQMVDAGPCDCEACNVPASERN